MAFKSYTSCVQPQDYQNPPATELEVGLADIVLFLTGGFTVLGPVAIFEIETLLEYLLNGKLICLDGDQCAVGQVIGFETPSSKGFPNDIDNDFSINLMLSPNQISDFIGLTLDQAYQLALQDGKNLQAQLITEQPGMPVPYQAEDSKRYVPYKIDPPVDVTLANQLGGGGAFFPFQTPIYVPVLHLECEGSRIHDLLAVLQGIGGLGTGICDFEILGIPIGKAICAIIATLLAPITVALLIAAWFNAHDGNADDPRTGGGGQLEPGNMIVVTGRWAYDAGHQGWNELHPVKSIQKIAESIVGFEASGDPKEIIDRWCTLVSQVPPPNRDGPGGTPSTMSPGQQAIWDSQVQPENRWILHPLIDGCLPPDQPPPTNIK